MKNIFLIGLTILTFASPLFGQVNFGIKGGVNYTNIHFNSGISSIDQTTKETTEPKFGYHAGVFLHVPFSKKWAFKPELLFSTQGQM